MLVLGIESSCDETAVSVVEYTEDHRLVTRSNMVASQIETHKLYGGVVPEIASRAHIEAISSLTKEALEEAHCTLKDLACIACTSHPGLIGALLVGVNFAKSLAISNGIPLVEVDHMKAHIAAAYLGLSELPKLPFLAMTMSGGHTSIYEVKDYTDFEVIGSTRDDAIGEAFDKIGRLIGIPYPAGAGFDALAKEGILSATNGVLDYDLYKKSAAYKDPFFKLPSPALPGTTLDFSFSGLKTAAINILHQIDQKGLPFNRALFAARYTVEVMDAVRKKVEMALDRYPKEALIVSGGVAANSHLRYALTQATQKKKVPLILPERGLCGDNGAMVAAQGCLEYLKGHLATSDLNARATDE